MCSRDQHVAGLKASQPILVNKDEIVKVDYWCLICYALLIPHGQLWVPGPDSGRNTCEDKLFCDKSWKAEPFITNFFLDQVFESGWTSNNSSSSSPSSSSICHMPYYNHDLELQTQTFNPKTRKHPPVVVESCLPIGIATKEPVLVSVSGCDATCILIPTKTM